MRRVCWLLFGLSICSACTWADAPPPTPEARARPRLRYIKPQGKLYTHNDAVLATATDLLVLRTIAPIESLRYYRYLSLHNIPNEHRQEYYAIISFLLNSLTGLGLENKARPTITLPARGGPGNILIRVNLFDYRIDPKAWDRLGKKDPYFHQTVLKQEVITRQVETIEQIKTGRVYRATDGNYYYETVPRTVLREVTEVTAPVKVQANAAWCDTAAQLELTNTLHTAFPILRADWWLANVTLEPFYSDFLGIKTLDDFKKLTGFDKRAQVKQTKATVVKSGAHGGCARVALNNRILAREPTFNGYFWRTYDFKTSIGEQNVITNFLNEKRDAAEFIASLPNGLQVYALVNDKDELIAAGDPDVVIDSMAYDGRVRNARSCIWCHAEGINHFKSQFQAQIGFRPDQADLGIFDKDPKRALELRQQIQDVFGLPDFSEIFSADCQLYAKAVKAANNLAAGDNARLFKAAWEGYQEELIDLPRLCYEIGMPEEDLKALLVLRFNGQSNGVLIQALLKPPISIRRDQFEENFFELGLLSTVRKLPTPPIAPTLLGPKR